jgi:hypothetical protein
MLLVVAFAGVMLYGFRYSMHQAIQTVIDSEPPPTKLADTPSFSSFEGCDFGATLYGSAPSRPCEFTPPTIPETPTPVQTMSKADSEKAASWFGLAALLLPLGLGGAAVAGYFLTRGND